MSWGRDRYQLVHESNEGAITGIRFGNLSPWLQPETSKRVDKMLAVNEANGNLVIYFAEENFENKTFVFCRTGFHCNGFHALGMQISFGGRLFAHLKEENDLIEIEFSGLGKEEGGLFNKFVKLPFKR